VNIVHSQVRNIFRLLEFINICQIIVFIGTANQEIQSQVVHTYYIIIIKH